jgi:hypothetical protein
MSQDPASATDSATESATVLVRLVPTHDGLTVTVQTPVRGRISPTLDTVYEVPRDLVDQIALLEAELREVRIALLNHIAPEAAARAARTTATGQDIHAAAELMAHRAALILVSSIDGVSPRIVEDAVDAATKSLGAGDIDTEAIDSLGGAPPAFIVPPDSADDTAQDPRLTRCFDPGTLPAEPTEQG